MNRNTIPPQTNPPYTNGHVETPLEVSGVSLRRPVTMQQPTVFAPDLPLRGLGPIFYGIQRFYLGGLPVARYVAALWLLAAAAAFLGILPGRWITVVLFLLLWVAQILLSIRLRQQQYVSFIPMPIPALGDAPLDISEKLPIYATGVLSVEGRNRNFSALPGFYRTFATGEHAILCRVAQRNWLGICTWPEDEIGMWYAFIKPNDIERLSWGNLTFGSVTQPALAIDYRLELPPTPRRKKTEVRMETLYLATPRGEDAQRIYMDLLTNLPDDKIIPSLSTFT